jgi:hypothetical protein
VVGMDMFDDFSDGERHDSDRTNRHILGSGEQLRICSANVITTKWTMIGVRSRSELQRNPNRDHTQV